MYSNKKLIAHAELTVRYLEMFKKHRNFKGLKKWERHLLESAKDALKETNFATPV